MKGDAACVIIETIPATYGFPMPKPGYLKAIKAMCERTAPFSSPTRCRPA